MDLFESNSHSFVIKIWLEETVEDSEYAIWRGRITHVTSGERQFIKSTDDIINFIWPYLENMSAKPDVRMRFARWLKRKRVTP